MTFTVVAAGAQSLVQDTGRPGYAAMGVSRSGAYDRASLRRANRIAGNPADAAGLEVLMGGLRLRAGADHLVCLSGAVGPADLDGNPVHHEWPTLVRAGQTLTLGTPVIGMRTYVTVRGSIEVAPVLGSRSTDLLSHIGPAPLTDGDVLTVGSVGGEPIVGEPAGGQPEWRLGTGDVTLQLTSGPHTGWFIDTALDLLCQTRWAVSAESNRVGLRLDGPRIGRKRTDELPSAPCLRGSIQITADGQPIVFGPDHPVTGGYPVIAVVHDADADLLGQARPGQGVRFGR